MKLVADLHTHTLRCGHAYSSLREMAEGARTNGLKIMATADHGPNMPGASHVDYFRHLPQIADNIEGVRVLKGVETNIIGFNGELDVPDEILAHLELVLVGFHPLCGYTGETREENTRALIGAIQNPLVDLVVHPGNPYFPIDEVAVVEAALQNDVIIEINNSSFRGSREGSMENCTDIACQCARVGTMMSIDSDAHLSFDVGRVNLAMELAERLELMEEQIINTSVDKVMDFVERKRKVKRAFLQNLRSE